MSEMTVISLLGILDDYSMNSMSVYGNEMPSSTLIDGLVVLSFFVTMMKAIGGAHAALYALICFLDNGTVHDKAPSLC